MAGVATSDIADPSLADAGRARIDWADAQMPVLRSIRERFASERPLDGITVAACLHVTAETANLVRALMAGGAEVALCAANPLSTQDETAAALAEAFGAEVHARRGEDADAYAAHVAACARKRPHVTLDDGADLVTLLHHGRPRVRERLVGGAEETTTGLLRVRQLEAEGGDVFVTVTGSRAVLRREHFERMKDGAILANAGHFDVEVDLDGLRELAVEVRDVLPLVEQYDLGDRRLNLLASGRVVNLAAGRGHPAAVMDMSFALQALVVEDLIAHGGDRGPGVHPVPAAIDREVARLKLAALDVDIDELTPEQAAYRDSWG